MKKSSRRPRAGPPPSAHSSSICGSTSAFLGTFLARSDANSGVFSLTDASYEILVAALQEHSFSRQPISGCFPVGAPHGTRIWRNIPSGSPSLILVENQVLYFASSKYSDYELSIVFAALKLLYRRTLPFSCSQIPCHTHPRLTESSARISVLHQSHYEKLLVVTLYYQPSFQRGRQIPRYLLYHLQTSDSSDDDTNDHIFLLLSLPIPRHIAAFVDAALASYFPSTG